MNKESFTKEEIQDLFIKLYEDNIPYSCGKLIDGIIVFRKEINDFIHKEVLNKQLK